MKLLTLIMFLSEFGATSAVGAAPASLENFDYKVNFSETLPGVDNAPPTVDGPVINVDVTDKLRNNTTRFPLKVYSINEYFLVDDKLNLLCRTTLRDTTRQFYSMIQLNFSNAPDSRQFSGLKKYFFSSDNGSLLAVFDQDGQEDALGLIRLNQGPAQLGWIYSEREQTNLFLKALPALGKNIRLASVVGWSADALTAAFVLSGNEGTADAPVLKYYLACVTLDGDHFQTAVEPVDLSAYALPAGGTIDKIDCVGNQAALYFPPKNMADNGKVTFKLPQPSGASKKD